MASNKEYFSQVFRKWTGYFLAFYTLLHLLAHSCGIFGLTFLESVQTVSRFFWRFPVINALLYISLVTHVTLSLIKNLKRKSFKGLDKYEWTQLITGLLIPLILSSHIAANRVLHLVFDVDMRYSAYLFASPAYISYLVYFMTVLVLVHSFIGIRNNFFLKPWYHEKKHWIALIFILVPIFAFFGIINAKREAFLIFGNDPEAVKSLFARVNPQNIDIVTVATQYGSYAATVYILLIGSLFSARALYIRWKKSLRTIRVSYLNGVESLIFDGASLLDASIMAGIPHAHICGGRGRCSTCRVRIEEGMEFLNPIQTEEKRVLRRIGAAPNVRLACQTFPSENTKIHPMLPSDATPEAGYEQKRYAQGSDQNIVVLFADMRGFTKFSEKKLPYDVVFVLNEYFKLMGASIETAGGYLDKFIGDGTMALFGIEKTIQEGSIDALKAVYYMSQNLKNLNEFLQAELTEPLKIGIGLHSGQVILGKMGYKHTTHMTAIGDVVNTASRLESMTKELGVQLIVSENVVKQSRLDFSSYPKKMIKIRGRDEEIGIYMIDDAEKLETILNEHLKKIEIKRI